MMANLLADSKAKLSEYDEAAVQPFKRQSASETQGVWNKPRGRVCYFYFICFELIGRSS
jgi:hypothetical protein